MSNYQVDLNGDFIYRGCVDGAGEMTTIRKAKTYVSDFWGVYTVDLAPGCYAPPLRVFVCNAGSVSDAIDAIMEAARDMGPSKNPNRTNLFIEFYGECDGAACWCQRAYGEDSQITIGGKEYHENEGVVLGIARVTSRDQIHA